MNTNKKGQGLPINTIILIAIGLLILVLFITFVLGGFSGLTGTTSNSLSGFIATCSSSCSTAQAEGVYPQAWCDATASSGGKVYNCANATSGGATCAVTISGTSTTYGGATSVGYGIRPNKCTS
jgi:hypothetical protein